MCRVFVKSLVSSARRPGFRVREKAGRALRAGGRAARVSIRRLLQDESGATAIEYGLIVVGLSIAILATIFAIGDELNNLFGVVQTLLEGSYS